MADQDGALALELIQRVASDIEGIKRDLAAISADRQKEAYDRGALDTKFQDLQNRLVEHEKKDNRRQAWFLGITGTVVAAGIIGLGAFFVRMVATHPGSVQ